jgi:hypothetical protein
MKKLTKNFPSSHVVVSVDDGGGGGERTVVHSCGSGG